MVSAKILANELSKRNFDARNYKKGWMDKIGKNIEKENRIAFLISKFMKNDYFTHIILKNLSKIASKYLKSIY